MKECMTNNMLSKDFFFFCLTKKQMDKRILFCQKRMKSMSNCHIIYESVLVWKVVNIQKMWTTKWKVLHRSRCHFHSPGWLGFSYWFGISSLKQIFIIFVWRLFAFRSESGGNLESKSGILEELKEVMRHYQLDCVDIFTFLSSCTHY